MGGGPGAPARLERLRSDLRSDPSLLDAFLQQFARLVRRRMGQRAHTEIAIVITGGVPTDILERRREHAEDFAADKW